MFKNTKISILGTKYTLRFVGENSEPRLHGCNGSCNTNTKDIVVDNMSDYEDRYRKSRAEGYEEWCKRVTRHEIIHAFLYESGSCDYDEKLVDWIAVMLPKLYAACSEAKCL